MSDASLTIHGEGGISMDLAVFDLDIIEGEEIPASILVIILSYMLRHHMLDELINELLPVALDDFMTENEFMEH